MQEKTPAAAKRHVMGLNPLAQLRQLLSSQLTQEEIEVWLHRPNPHLDGRSPLDAIAEGDIDAAEHAASELARSDAGN